MFLMFGGSLSSVIADYHDGREDEQGKKREGRKVADDSSSTPTSDLFVAP